MPVSQKFISAVKLDSRRQYELAWEADVNPTTLSQIVIGYIRPEFGDLRVIKIGALLGLKLEECFERPNANKGGEPSSFQEAAH